MSETAEGGALGEAYQRGFRDGLLAALRSDSPESDGYGRVPDEVRVEFTGKRVRSLRRRAGLTQEELAESVGIGQPHLSMIEAGQRSVSVELGVKMAAALNTTPEMVLLGRNPRPASTGGEPRYPGESDEALAFRKGVDYASDREADDYGWMSATCKHATRVRYDFDSLPEGAVPVEVKWDGLRERYIIEVPDEVANEISEGFLLPRTGGEDG